MQICLWWNRCFLWTTPFTDTPSHGVANFTTPQHSALQRCMLQHSTTNSSVLQRTVFATPYCVLWVTYRSVVSHVLMRRTRMDEWNGANMNTSCQIYRWVVSQIWTNMSHGTHMNTVTHMNTYEWVLSNTSMSTVTYTGHVTHVNELCHLFAWATSRLDMCTTTARVWR